MSAPRRRPIRRGTAELNGAVEAHAPGDKGGPETGRPPYAQR